MHALFLPFLPKRSPFSITHQDPIFLIGSCFSIHIARGLEVAKFPILSNPSGNLFDPLSIAQNLRFYAAGTQFTEKDLQYYDELYFSWHHHSELATPHLATTLEKINQAHQEAQHFLRKTRYLFITLGSAFYYILKTKGTAVANCHKYPARHFERKLLSTQTIVSELVEVVTTLQSINPHLHVILTISPVRHAKEGVGIIDNNRSKARLIESTHILLNDYGTTFSYFPAYEILIDVLRDYRFYDADLVHPNYLATETIFHFFVQTFMNEATQEVVKEMTALTRAIQHKAMHPDTQKHQQFLRTQLQKIAYLEKQYPYLSFHAERQHFQQTLREMLTH